MNDWNDDDAWGNDPDFGEVVNDDKKKKAKATDDTKTNKYTDKTDKDETKADKKKDYFAQDDENDDFDKDFVDKNEDKFNKVLSTSKENGGLLASIGLKNKDFDEASLDSAERDSEGAPHNKSDLFDTSKDRIAKKGGAKAKEDKSKGKDSDEEFDLGFNSDKKDKESKKEAALDAQKGKKKGIVSPKRSFGESK